MKALRRGNGLIRRIRACTVMKAGGYLSCATTAGYGKRNKPFSRLAWNWASSRCTLKSGIMMVFICLKLRPRKLENGNEVQDHETNQGPRSVANRQGTRQRGE